MWAVGEGATFLFFLPICTIYSLWRISLLFFSSGKNDSGRVSIDTTGETTGRLKALDLTNPASVRLCMRYWAELGAILFYVWVCEKAPAVKHGERFSDSLLFWGLWCLFVIWSLYNIVENKGGIKSSTLLNRDQSEEWKGWMQYLFLAYHYFHESSVYNAIRLFVSCYVWMTGFGNFSFFYTKADFGVVRMLQMIWRLNFLVFWLCLMFGNTFILYYINPLHTFYFLTTFFVMRIGYSYNTDKWKIRSKLFIWAIIVFLVWEIPVVFNFLWGFVLSTESNPGAKSGTLHEWHFRSSLDHWSAVFGMIFALNYPAAAAWLDRVEGKPVKSNGAGGRVGGSKQGKHSVPREIDKNIDSEDGVSVEGEGQSLLEGGGTSGTSLDQESSLNPTATIDSSSSAISTTSSTTSTSDTGLSAVTSSYSSASKRVVLAPLLLGTVLYFVYVYQNDKRTYNSLHPYYFWIPLLTYVLVRNWNPSLRMHHSASLARMGKITLETYLMQHHIWLAKDAKALYVVIPNAPFLNLCVTSVTYVFVALRLFRITVGLRAIHVPQSESKDASTHVLFCVKHVVGVCAAVLVPYLVSSTLIAFNVATTNSYIGCSCVLTLGLGLIMLAAQSFCWMRKRADIASSVEYSSGSADAFPTSSSANEVHQEKRIFGPAPAWCDRIPAVLLFISIFLQLSAYMFWPTSVNTRGTDDASYSLWKDRGRHVVNFKGIQEQNNDMQWRDINEASSITKNRTISVYGDSIGRDTLISLGKLISGDKTTVKFDESDRHKDRSFHEPNDATLNFFWSPLTDDTLMRLSHSLRVKSFTSNEIVIISNGAWDMLHQPCREAKCGGNDGNGYFVEGVDKIMGAIDSRLRMSAHESAAIWIAPTLAVPENLPPTKSEEMTVEAGWNYRQALIDRKNRFDEILDGTMLTKPTPDEMRLQSKDGVHYDWLVYDSLAQGVLNYMKKPLSWASEDPRRKEESLAGISHNVGLGLLVLVALACMLLTFDIYLGFSNVALAMLGLPGVDMDAVYNKLHQTITKVGKLW